MSPGSPVFIYDPVCHFCVRWVERWRARTGHTVRFLPNRKWTRLWLLGVAPRLTRRAAVLVEPSGRRSSGAEAVLRLFRYAPGLRVVGALGLLPGIRQLARVAYRFIASHRVAASRVDSLLLGERRAAPSTTLVRWLFLRGLGLVFFAAFHSLGVQVQGLYGKDGITPLQPRLRSAQALMGSRAWRDSPSIFWLDASDRRLLQAVRAGKLASTALLLNFAPRLSIAAAWGLYLSFVSVVGEFLAFQWDLLLLENAIDALLVAPGGLLPGFGRGKPSAAGTWLLRWLAFRLHFESGIAKLQSGDPTWHSLTACSSYFETAPLPTVPGWYAHHLPRLFQRLSTAAALALECASPWLALLPRRLRRWGFAQLMFLQAVIAATGNYGFFNLLAALDLLWLLDDEDLWPGWARAQAPRPARALHRVFSAAGALSIFALSASMLWARLRQRIPGHTARRIYLRVLPFASLNQYGLFSVMTTRRPEIIVEGSFDAQSWKAYELRYKPGSPSQRPRFIAPHMPRLDWLLWFAAMSSPPAWFGSFLVRLLEGRPEVLQLLAASPFSRDPPLVVRASLYEYRMTDLETHRRTGEWWRRERIGIYFPAVSLKPRPGTAHTAHPGDERC